MFAAQPQGLPLRNPDEFRGADPTRKIAKATERLTNRVLVGSPSAIFELLDNASPNTYREMGIS